MLNFTAQFKNGKNFSSKDGYWDDCPNDGITALNISLPFAIRKRNPDNTIVELEPSTIMIDGFEAYYFSHMAKSTVSVGSIQLSPSQPQYIGSQMIGLDYTHNFALQVIVDSRGNVKTNRYPLDKFIQLFHLSEKALRVGA